MSPDLVARIAGKVRPHRHDDAAEAFMAADR